MSDERTTTELPEAKVNAGTMEVGDEAPQQLLSLRCCPNFTECQPSNLEQNVDHHA